MAYFFYKLIPPRPSFGADMSDAERQLMRAHVHYWMKLKAEGKAVAFGPVSDPAGGYGVGIVELPDGDDPNELATCDPAIQSQSGFRVEIFTMPMLIARPHTG